MAQVLLIHSDSRFTRRISQEAGNQALIASTMGEASGWVADPAILLSGIYLSPADAGTSAFAFIESVLLQRPATPLFIFDPESRVEPGSAPSFLTDLHIKAVFRGNETFETLLSPLRRIPQTWTQIAHAHRLSEAPAHAGHMAIPVSDLADLPVFPFDLFMEDDSGALCLIGVMNNRIEPEYLAALALNTPWVYVRETSLYEVRDRVRSAGKTYMEIEELPHSWKSAETLNRAGRILRKLQAGRSTRELADQAGAMVSDLMRLVSTLGTSKQLGEFLRMAGRCDRTIRCTTLAILLAKILRYEHESTVSILGLAAFFQDLSLIQSPFGNLVDADPSGLSAEIREYFKNHPIRSAELLSGVGSLPDVTLQVIRQHHERPDRTGYPERTGGAKLHPMAEILSLINAYLDQEPGSGKNQKEMLSHYSDGVVRAFLTLVQYWEGP